MTSPILATTQICKTWRIVTYDILFHIDSTRIRRVTTWLFLGLRINAFQDIYLRYQKTSPKLEPLAAEWDTQRLSQDEAQWRDKVRFAEVVKENVETEGIEHIWAERLAERSRGRVWEWHASISTLFGMMVWRGVWLDWFQSLCWRWSMSCFWLNERNSWARFAIRYHLLEAPTA